MAIKGTWNDKGTLPIVCPACKRTTHETIAKLQQSGVLVCPGCGKTTQCTSDFLAAIKAPVKVLECGCGYAAQSSTPC